MFHVQVVSMLKGDLPLPWEVGLSKKQERQLGTSKDAVMQLLQRDPAKRSDMPTFQAACRNLILGTVSKASD